MAGKKSKTRQLFGSILLADRFSDRKAPRPAVQRGSITEYSGISRLGERLDVSNRRIAMPREEPTSAEVAVEQKYYDVISKLNYDLCIPPRVPFDCIEKGEYKAVETFVFNYWKSLRPDNVFERNIEIWRQFWITCERADTIAQIVDARDPQFFMNRDIVTMYPNKRHLLLYNKADLISEEQENAMPRLHGMETHLYSTKDKTFSYDFQGPVGLIGYPNVGKSSTINLILQQKKVKVSATPGKTKHIQTVETPSFTLIDCPGLVFPGHNKISLALHGVLNVDQIPELNSFEQKILEYVGKQKIAAHYRLPPSDRDFLTAMAAEKSWVKSKCLRMIVKDFAAGLIR